MARIELLSIGDELLKGMTFNTNATFLAQQLYWSGYEVTRQVTVPDIPERLEQECRAALARSDIVIATGGLGPTLDDQTRRVAAHIFSSPFHTDPLIIEDIKRRFGNKISSLEDQATIPLKAKPFLNEVGTAPGLVFSEQGKVLVLLPGVPLEMETMFIGQVLPFLKMEFPLQERSALLQLHFSIIPESAIDPVLRQLHVQYPIVEMGIYPGWGTVSVTLSSMDSKALQAVKKALLHHFQPYYFPEPTIAESVHHQWIKEQYSLAFAESCTGGDLARQLTMLPGASTYLLGSIVAYSNALKKDVLGVSEATLDAHGAVSQQTVEEMLIGLLRLTSADWGIAVSGIAGPCGGTPQKPVGTIYAAIGRRGELPDSGCFKARGNRQAIIQKTTQSLLGALYRKAVYGLPAFPLVIEPLAT